MEQNYVDQIGLKRVRVIIRYPDRNSSNGLRWSDTTSLIDSDTSSGTLVPISRLWSAVAYIPFPEITFDTLNLPQTPVVSEEQNASLELHDGIPLLHLTMWERDAGHATSFTNKAYNLCLGIEEAVGTEDIWTKCQTTAPPRSNGFIPDPHHILHRSTRQHFFDITTKPIEPNNLPVLMVKAGKASITLKNTSEIVTTLITSCLQGRVPFVIKALGNAVRSIDIVATFKEWRTKLFDCLHKLLWSGKHDQIVSNIFDNFILWCKQTNYYPAWALTTDSLKGQPRYAYTAWITNSAASYDHDYGQPYLSHGPLVEETRILTCDASQREFMWQPGYTKSSLLTSDWLKRRLELRNQLIEVKTNQQSFTGTRLEIPQY